MGFLINLLYIVFVGAAIVLVVVILLQEGKGGGLSDALGTAGQQTFGVATKGIQRFTGIAAAVFLVSALSIHFLNRVSSGRTVLDDLPSESAPEAPAGAGGEAPPPGGG